MEAYIHSFAVGSVQSHKEGSRHWIRDKGPIVEACVRTIHVAAQYCIHYSLFLVFTRL